MICYTMHVTNVKCGTNTFSNNIEKNKYIIFNILGRLTVHILDSYYFRWYSFYLTCNKIFEIIKAYYFIQT